MRKAICFFIITMISVFVILAGCSKSLPDTYTHPNKDQPIVSVELMYNSSWVYTGEEFKTVRTLNPQEIPLFMDELYALPTQKNITPPARDFGPNIVKVTYENGDIEFFASWHIEFVKSGEEIAGVGAYAFVGEGFDQLYDSYRGQGDGLPEGHG